MSHANEQSLEETVIRLIREKDFTMLGQITGIAFTITLVIFKECF